MGKQGSPGSRTEANATGRRAAPPQPPRTAGVSRYATEDPRRANAPSIFMETLLAWRRDLPALTGIQFAYGAGIVGITLAVTLAAFGTAFPTTRDLNTSLASWPGGVPATYLVVRLLLYLLNGLFGVIFTAAMTYHTIEARRGEPVSWSAAFRAGARRFRSVLGGALVLGLLGSSLLALELAPLAGEAAGTLDVVMRFAFVLLLFPYIYVAVALGLYAAAAMMEHSGAVVSLRRSWSLSRGYRWSIFGAELLAIIPIFALSEFVAVPASGLGSPVVSAVAQIVVTTITGSWLILLPAVAYELIGDEQRRQALLAMSAPHAPGPEVAPAYAHPEAPPCPVCGRALLWVPAYRRWYCLQCGAYR